MKKVYGDDKHPDVISRNGPQVILRFSALHELEDLETISSQATSSAELHWIQQKKLELFKRIFGF